MVGTSQFRARVLIVVLALAAVGVTPLAPAPAAIAIAPDRFGAAAVDPAIDRSAAGAVSVIVRGVVGLAEATREAIVGAGGTIVADLPLIDGFEASVAPEAVDDLAQSPSILSISDNAEGTFEEYSYDETTTASSFALTSGATQGWTKGVLGRGIGVAVIDTGVSPMPDFKGRLIHGPDLSGEASTLDTYGHGTVMAGVIGGSGADSAGRIGGAYTGVAPMANIIAIKTAGRNGVVDVSTILQAMHWVAAYRTQYNIRVLNLSWGTPSTQNHSVDPLNYAVQRLWRDGITVVVASGNSGPGVSTVTKPGDDPTVITVGAFDDKGNIKETDDGVTSWSSRGPTAAGVTKPDIVAPGRSLIATRAFGSDVDIKYPKAHIEPSYIKGSGTSEAAAVVSGLVALMLEARPGLTPDQVKAILKSTALPIGTIDANTQGAGRVRLGAALAAPVPAVTQSTTSNGLGSLEASRGGHNVDTDCLNDGTVDTIRGEIDVRCEPWDPMAWTTSAWDGTAWMGDIWEGRAWTDATWSGRAWTGGAWTGRAWTGRAWTGRAWTDSSWTGRAWTGSSWTGSSWTTAEYGDWTTAEYDEGEFLTAWWGPKAPPGRIARLDAMDQLRAPSEADAEPSTPADAEPPPNPPAAQEPRPDSSEKPALPPGRNKPSVANSPGLRTDALGLPF